jgi:hypothetical protein
MSLDSPASIIYNSDGYEVSVKNNTALPSNSAAILIAGSDGSNTRYVTLDSSGRSIIAGAGSAGTPAGGVLTIQGASGGQTVPVSGTVTVSVSNIGTTGSAVPSSSALIGGTDGTNLQALKVYDLDTGAGVDYDLGVSIRLPASGGSVAGGTVTNPIRIDPTGTTTQPISGTITVTQGTASSLLASIGGLGTSGSAVVGAPVRIGGSDGTNTRDILTDTSGRLIMIGTAANGAAATGNPVLIAGSDGTNARTLKTSSDGTLAVSTTPTKSSTGTSSNVSSSATNVTLLSSNANRLGATVYNDSTKTLYLKLGSTASLTSFTVKLTAQAYYEVPANYTGQIDGIWDSVNGNARLTELT